MHAARVDHVRDFLHVEKLDAFLLTASPDIRWCCGFTGSAGLLLVDRSTATLFTDGRYQDQAADEVSTADIVIYQEGALDHISEAGLLSHANAIGIDSSCVTLAFANEVEDLFPDLRLYAVPSPFRERIAQKETLEIAALRRAQALTDAVFEELLQLIRPGITEKEIASEITCRHLTKGAEGMSFPPIVASGPNGALPHASPTARTIKNGDLVVLDFGCFVDGYASDMTRTVAVGMPSSEARSAYEVVRLAQHRAQTRAKAGMPASELDFIGRRVIVDAGYGKSFSHSLGHGIGLRIHEWPRIGRRCNYALPENSVITIEPGIYIPDSFGIRIENAVLLTSTGAEQLPASDTSLIVL
ncbi:aminopeptidase P family protein [Bacteroidota bacterium]